MNPRDLVEKLLSADDAETRHRLLTPQPAAFWYAVADLLKEAVDEIRLRDPRVALARAEVAAEVAAFADLPYGYALAAWARGNVLIHQGEYSACLTCYQRAEDFFAAEGDEVAAARLRVNQAFVFKNLGRYDEGIQTAQAAIAMLRMQTPKMQGPCSPSIFLASAHNALGTLSRLSGRYDEALAAFSECVRLYTALDEPVRLARAWINQANLLENLDRFTEAESLLQRAREILVAEARFLEVARADLNLGVLYTRIGRYDAADRALTQAERGFANLDNALEEAVVDLYRADLYAAFNLHEDLLRRANRDWPVFEEREMQWHVARALLHQARAWRSIEAFTRAEDVLKRAHAAFVRIGDPVWIQRANLERAALWAAMDDWIRVLPLALEAVWGFLQYGIESFAARGALLVAKAHLVSGRVTDALIYYRQSDAIGERLHIPALCYRAQHGLGRVAEANGEVESARQHYARAVTLIEDVRQRLPVEDFRLGFLEDKLDVYQDGVRLCLQLGYEAEALAYVERAKSGALVDLLLANFDRFTQDATVDASLHSRLVALREQLNWHYADIDTQSKLTGDASDQRQSGGEVERQLWAQIAALEGEITQIWHTTQHQWPLYVPWDRLEGLSSYSLQPDESLLHYYIAGEQIQVFILDAHGLRACVPLTCTVSQVSETIAALSTTIATVMDFGPAYVMHTLLPLSHLQLNWLYQDLIAPLLPFLAEIERLIISPDGVLFNVPFHALCDGEICLSERYEIAYVPNAGVLQLCRAAYHGRRNAPRAPLIVGYARGQALPHVVPEISQVAYLLPEAVTLTGEDATLAAILEHAAHTSCLHLATHAVFRQDNPLFSALQLARGEWLRALDLYALRLEGALVTLSGCETGRHRLLGGDLVGLSRGFFAAVASALLVSLWPVDDVAAQLLMKHFYTE
ncbi:MAG: CHAT domain-containing protein [Anaerolineae bacterium]|nr:CHAT domain-containing protein [Anaerolineae bacterium]